MRNELSLVDQSVSCQADFYTPRTVLTYKTIKPTAGLSKINFSDLNWRSGLRLCYVCKLCFKESLTAKACQPIGHIYVFCQLQTRVGDGYGGQGCRQTQGASGGKGSEFSEVRNPFR